MAISTALIIMSKDEDVEMLNEMYRFSDLIQCVYSPEDMESLSLCLAKQLEEVDVKEFNPFVIHSISHNLCAKFLILMYEGFDFPDSAFYLLGLMFERKMILPVYQSKLSELLSKKISEKNGQLTSLRKKDSAAFYPSGIDAEVDDKAQNDGNSGFKFNIGCFKAKNYNNQILNVINLDNNTERYVNKRFGYALLDMTGKFLWIDENTQKFFELKPEELYEKTLFELMIPHSKKYLQTKFGGNLGERLRKTGETETFTYVIYSRNSSEKFIKQTKKLHKSKKDAENDDKEDEQEGRFVRKMNIKIEDGESDPDDIHQKMTIGTNGCRDKDLECYYKYLKALSSKITSIALTFTKGEFLEIVKNKKYNINFKDDENELKEMDKWSPDSLITKNAIFLETRMSRNVPKFNYSILEGSQHIRVLQELITKKLKKKDITVKL